MSTSGKAHRQSSTQNNTQVQATTKKITGKLLHDGEYLLQRALISSGENTIFLATHTYLSLPLVLKQFHTNQPLPEPVIAELDYMLHGGDITQRPLANTTTLQASSDTQQFLREALLLARLQHTAIPTLYDYFAEDGNWYLVTDYIPGRSLAAYLHQYAPLPAPEALHYALQICTMLDYLHQQVPPILCWSLAPEHFMLIADGTIMFTGIALTHTLTAKTDPTQAITEGQAGQTPIPHARYAAPEQQNACGVGNIDTRTDLYSLGLMLYEMLSGQLPTDKTPPELTLTSLTTSNAALLPDVSRMLSSLVKLAIQPEPADRFQSAHTFSLALERAYRIEERRMYQQQLADAQSVIAASEEALSRQTEQTSEPSLQNEEIAGITAHMLDLEQRRLTREALHRARQERLQLEQLENQLASFDESLTRRSNMSQSLYALEAQRPRPRRSLQRYALYALRLFDHAKIRRFIQISFILALLLFLILSSLLIYARIRQYIQSQGQQRQFATAAALTETTPQGISIKPTVPDIPTSSWQQLALFPIPAADNAAANVILQGSEFIYANGGYRGHAAHPRYDHSLYRYDIVHARWQNVADGRFPGMVNNAAATDERGNIFFSAGYAPDSSRIPSLLYRYQAAAQQLHKIVPPGDIHLGFANTIFADQHGHLYLTQGYLQAGHPTTHAGTGWYRFDIASKHWHRLADLPVGLGYVTLAGATSDKTASRGDAILLFGGSLDAGQQQQSDKIYRYDIATDSWSQAPTSMPTTLSAAAGCSVWPGQYVLVGGYAAPHNLTTAWLFDLHTLKARPLAATPNGGTALGAAACDGHGHVYVIRGTNTPQQPTRDFWQLSVRPNLIINDE